MNSTPQHMPMVYSLQNGLMVASSGPVTIDGVRHRIDHGFVVCNRSLNGRAWNVTSAASNCPLCYPDAIIGYIQGELFEARA